MPAPTMDEVVALCKRRGLIFPASEIYGGIANTYDYGHYGVLLKNNVINAWWRAMIQERDDVVALDSAIIQHPRTWEASGHLAGFTDPLVDCKTCGSASAPTTSPSCAVRAQAVQAPGRDARVRPHRVARVQPDVRDDDRPGEGLGSTVYLRPETAQGIFLDFKTTLQYARRKPPFGIAQVGKSFRNEITPGNFIFRTLEFEQMEMEFFVPPDEAEQWHEHWMQARMDWYVSLGIDARAAAPARARRRRALALLVGDVRHRVPVSDRLVRARGHRQPRRLRPQAARRVLRREARVLRPADRRALRPARDRAGRRRRPHRCSRCCATPTTGRDRRREAHRPAAAPAIAPVKVAVLPLLRKDGHPEKAREIYLELRKHVSAEYDEGGAIGRRYRRQDEIGTPLAVTVDHQTLEDDTVTLRDRDTLEQERVPAAELVERVTDVTR